MPFNPKVTIIIPVYNGSNFLSEAINSALDQTYKYIEVIVINDGSQDKGKTESIAKEYGNKIRYFHKKNGGVASALNLGICKSTGEYISWLSHDDIYLPDKISKQVNYLAKTSDKKLIVFGDFEVLDLTTGTTFMHNTLAARSDILYNNLLMIFKANLHGCTLLIPNDVFKNVGLFNEKLLTTQDYDLWARAIKNGYKFFNINSCLIKTRWHDAQGTITMSNIHRKEVENFYKNAIDLLDEEFSLLSFLEISSFISEVRNKFNKNTKNRIIKHWRTGTPIRYALSFLIR